jgi:amino acid transporter
MNTEKPRFKKELRLRDLYFAALTGVIGSGWIYGSYYAAGVVGPASIISWLVGGIFILIIALTWAEVSSKYPVAGAGGRYYKFSHGSLANAMAGFSAILPAIATPAIESIAIVGVVQAALATTPYKVVFVNAIGVPTPAGTLFAILISLFFFYINYIGIRRVANVNSIVSYIKLPILLILIASLIIAGLGSGLGVNFTTPSFAPYGVLPIFTAVPATGIVFAYLGFRQPIEMAGEAKNPTKDLPRAIILLVLTVIVIYTLLEVAFIAGLKWNDKAVGTFGVLPGQWSLLTTNLSTSAFPLFYISLGLGLFWLAGLVAVGGVIGPGADTNQYYASTARILYGMGREGYFGGKKARMAQVEAKHHVPLFGLLVTLGVTIILLMLGFAGYIVSSIGGFWVALTAIITTTLVFAYTASSITLPIFRKYSVDSVKNAFELKRYKIIAPIAFIISSLLVYWGSGSLFTSGDPDGGYILIIIMLLGGFLYFWSENKNTMEDIKASLWMIIYLASFIQCCT